jgi:hypothetical protein
VSPRRGLAKDTDIDRLLRNARGRCALEHPPFADPNPERGPALTPRYDLKETAPYVDSQGISDYLRYGYVVTAPLPDQFIGWGFRKIRAKHGWSTADQDATREALSYPPIKPGVFQSPNTYQRYGVDCRRQVIVSRGKGQNEPVQKGIVNSYGRNVSER